MKSIVRRSAFFKGSALSRAGCTTRSFCRRKVMSSTVTIHPSENTFSEVNRVMPRNTLTKAYMLVVIAGGVAAVTSSAIHLPLARIDVRFLALTVLTITISSRLTVRIPRISGHISVSDTFFFLTMLLYGGEAAVLLAAAETLCSSLRFSKKEIHIRPLTVVFNSAMMAASMFVTFVTVRFFFGDIAVLRAGGFSGKFAAALSVMALVQYACNCSLAAVHTSLK